MNYPRNQVATALFSVLSGLNGTGPGQFNFATFSRTTRIWSDVPPASQPAGFLLYVGEDDAQDQAFVARVYQMHFYFLAYFRTGLLDSQVAEEMAFLIIDAIDGTPGKPGLIGNNALPQTLGGLVANTWIQGRIIVDTGVTDEQAFVAIPIEVLTGQ